MCLLGGCTIASKAKTLTNFGGSSQFIRKNLQKNLNFIYESLHFIFVPPNCNFFCEFQSTAGQVISPKTPGINYIVLKHVFSVHIFANLGVDDILTVKYIIILLHFDEKKMNCMEYFKGHNNNSQVPRAHVQKIFIILVTQ